MSALLAALGVGVCLLLSTPDFLNPHAVQASSPSFAARATISPGSVSPGAQTSIIVSVSSASAARAAVDVEVYDSSGKSVLEHAYDDQSFAAGEKKTYSFTWAVPSNAPRGAYSVQSGVFSTDWNTQYLWDASAGTFFVGNGGPNSTPTASPTKRTPTPTLTQTASNTPTPTPTPTSAPTLTSGGGSMSGLHVSGSQVVNGAGQPVRLLGVNRSSPEYACAEGWGIFDGTVDQNEVNAMLSWHITAVRIPLNEDCWLGINGVQPQYAGANYQAAIAQYVALLNRNHIAAILNLHFNAPGSQLAKGQQPMADRDHSPAFWSSVAGRFANNGQVMFEPYNEPYPDNGNDSTAGWQCWLNGGTCAGVSFIAAGMQELVTAIRNTGARNIIILTGQNWGSQLDQWLQYQPSDPANQLAAGWHSYGDGLDCQDAACWNSTLTNVLKYVPIVATEIGEFDCNHGYIDNVLNFLDSHGQSYLAWTWGPYNCAAEPALITDWSGTPTQAYGQGYKNHLLSQP
ncbi:MAG: glycoside hydrolase family 5 protein [Chloroflexota bacterium]|nr:glycoside hydrolase family 5 protein [Chloroflexota bacterium]